MPKATLPENLINPKQQAAIDFLYENDRTILIAPTGAGKTVICLTAIEELQDVGHVGPVVVACPAKIVQTKVWSKEAAKWDHLKDLKVVELIGDHKKRAEILYSANADVVVVSLNSLEWFLKQKHHGCDGIIIDELSKAAGKQARG